LDPKILGFKSDRLYTRDLRETPKPDYHSDSDGVGVGVGIGVNSKEIFGVGIEVNS
jgi:hypothetical protein